MNRFYVAYSGKEPVSFEINGHRLIVLAQDKGAFEDELDTLGADSIRTIKVDDGEFAEQKFFKDFALKNGAGVVVMPPNLQIDDLLESLIDQLPWIQ